MILANCAGAEAGVGEGNLVSRSIAADGLGRELLSSSPGLASDRLIADKLDIRASQIGSLELDLW